ncbi:MAG: LysR family transcriptional regulator [Bradymonadia bacterium]
MNWDNLRVFLALSRQGTVKGAAELLAVSRSTINRRLEILTGEVKTDLFERLAHGIGLTEAGEALLPIAERVEEEVLSAERLFAGQPHQISGPVELTLFELAGQLLAPTLAELQQAHPEIQLRLNISNQTRSLRRRECDLAIRGVEQPSDDLFGRVLGVLEYAVYGTHAVVAQDNPPWVLWADHMGASGTWNLARALSQPLHVAALVDAELLMLSLARNGVGLALLPVPVAERYPELVPVGPVPREGVSMKVWMLTHPDLRRSGRVRAVMKFLAERAPEQLRSRSRA